MRKLNRKQELMIQDYYNNNPGMAFIDDSLISKIENINDYETLIDDINRYYDDLKCNTKKEKQYNSDYARYKRGEPIESKAGLSTLLIK